MKKLIPILLLLGVAALVFQLFIQFLIKYHDIDYSIATKDNSYLINEKLRISGKKNMYSFKVVDSNENTYIFDFSNDYNRQDRVIKDIKFFDEGDLKCIFPIYKKKKTSDIYCNYDGSQVSYSYLKQIGNEEIEKIVSKLKKDKYEALSWKKESTVSSDLGTYKVYIGNVPENVYFTMWFYRGFHVVSKEKAFSKEFMNNDHYENDLSFLTGNYYVSINTDMNSGGEYTTFYLYDVVNGGKGRIDLNDHISTNMYFNGQYNGNLYLTDLSSKKQYVLNPDKETFTEIGNTKDGFKSKQGNGLVNVLAKDYLKSNDIWTNVVTNNRLKEMYNASLVKKDGDMYYFLTEEGDFYKTYKIDLKNAVKLFHFDSVSEWNVKDGSILVVSKDSLYYYDDVYGLLKIASSNELVYNFKNICDFVKK